MTLTTPRRTGLSLRRSQKRNSSSRSGRNQSNEENGSSDMARSPEKRRTPGPSTLSILAFLASGIALFALMSNLMNLKQLMGENIRNIENNTHFPPLKMKSRALRSQTEPMEQLQQRLQEELSNTPSEEQVFRRMIHNSIISLEECEHRDAATTVAKREKKQQQEEEEEVVVVLSNNSTTVPETTHHVADVQPTDQKGGVHSVVPSRRGRRRRRRQLLQGAGGSLNNPLSKRTSLTRMGLMNHLTNFLAVSSTTTTTSSSMTCRYPPASSCHTRNYTILVTSTGNSEKLRTLFNNIYSWLDYPSMSKIVVLLPLYSNTTVANDGKYGDRLMDWSSDPRHAVDVHFVGRIWEAASLWTILETAILWMDGDQVFEGNRRGIEAGFALWKQHSDSLVTSKGWTLAFQDDDDDDDDNDDADENADNYDEKGEDVSSLSSTTTSAPRRRRLQQQQQQQQQKQQQQQQQEVAVKETSSTAIAHQTQNQQQQQDDEDEEQKIHSDGLMSFCKDDSVLLSRGVHEVHIPELSGMFHHRNYLCFASHKVLQTFRDFAPSLHESRMALSTLFTQLAETPPRLFPAAVFVPKLKDNEDKDGGKTKKSKTKKRWLKSVGKRSTRRRLTEVKAQVSDMFVTEVLGYLGSMPSESISWCQDRQACSTSLRNDGDDVVALQSDLPWMNATGC